MDVANVSSPPWPRVRGPWARTTMLVAKLPIEQSRQAQMSRMSLATTNQWKNGLEKFCRLTGHSSWTWGEHPGRFLARTVAPHTTRVRSTVVYTLESLA